MDVGAPCKRAMVWSRRGPLNIEDGMVGIGALCTSRTESRGVRGPALQQQGGVRHPDGEARVPGKSEVLDAGAKRPSYLAAHEPPPRTQGPAGATHRSWDRDPLPLPGPLVRISGAPTDSPSVLSPLPSPFPD